MRRCVKGVWTHSVATFLIPYRYSSSAACCDYEPVPPCKRTRDVKQNPRFMAALSKGIPEPIEAATCHCIAVCEFCTHSTMTAGLSLGRRSRCSVL